jgi:fructose/tagatose bisphosphate aldolase
VIVGEEVGVIVEEEVGVIVGEEVGVTVGDEVMTFEDLQDWRHTSPT